MSTGRMSWGLMRSRRWDPRVHRRGSMKSPDCHGKQPRQAFLLSRLRCAFEPRGPSLNDGTAGEERRGEQRRGEESRAEQSRAKKMREEEKWRGEERRAEKAYCVELIDRGSCSCKRLAERRIMSGDDEVR
eukprot:749767-Hanusia_phi.AAC.4